MTKANTTNELNNKQSHDEWDVPGSTGGNHEQHHSISYLDAANNDVRACDKRYVPDLGRTVVSCERVFLGRET